jgi:hypothetical protein
MGLRVTVGMLHISLSLFTGGEYVTFHEKEFYVTYTTVLHCKVREYASTWAKTSAFIFSLNDNHPNRVCILSADMT